MKNHCCRTLLFVLMVAAGCAAQSGGVSLGELARKNRTKQKPVMVFDDDTMRRSAVTDQDTGSGTAAPGSSADAATSQADAPTRDKKPDKKEAKSSTSSPGDDNVSKLQKRLDSLKQEQSAWSKSAKDYEEKLANETDEFRRQTYEEALKNDKSNVQVYQRRIDQTEEELAKAQQQSATKPDNSAQGPEKP